MLQIQHIKKDYKTGTLVQHALNDVSLNLRDNEFVAILGPSGSGKTTLLNVVGGLDRYDSGDLIINGVSTKKYKDRDWDAYRNHTIGFVFQSYNLIMHQTVLSNVELALTISGISGRKRREMAENALRKVGLAEQMHKKPGQMSGGQMQRVAIARALVNNPDIVLADEPTGALDSETSVQIMDLLKEVAKDKLVVMVTHNPELAREYATRIVTFKDGHVIDDTEPFEPEIPEKEPIHKRLGRASMSFATALGLSFNNLKTKKARTLLVAFAGSIGIIGIALILALSTGVNTYIKNMEEETLSEYPLQLRQSGMDLSSMLSSSFVGTDEDTEEEAEERKIRITNVVEQMFGEVEINNLGKLKTHLEKKEASLSPYVRAVEYEYAIKPLIYQVEDGEELKVNPSELVQNISGGSVFSSMMGGSSMDIFYQLPVNEALYEDAYELKAGSWPKSSEDLVLVLSPSGGLTDLVPYVLNIKDQEALKEKIEEISRNKKGSSKKKAKEEDEEELILSYDEFLGRQFRLVNNSAVYVYDDEYEIWTDKSDNEEFMEDLIANGKVLTITGIVAPKDDSSAAMLSSGIAYPASLTQEIIREAAESDVVKAQLSDEKVNVFTGKEFGEEADGLDFGKLFNIDAEAISNMFSGAFGGLSSLDFSSLLGNGMDLSSMDLSSMDLSDMDLSELDLSNLNLGGEGMDASGFIDGNELSKLLPNYSEEEIAAMMNRVLVPKTPEDWNTWLSTMFTNVINGYMTYVGGDPTADIKSLGVTVQEYLLSSDAREILESQFAAFLSANADKLLTEDEIKEMVTKIVQGFAVYLMSNDSILEDIRSSSGMDLLTVAAKVKEIFETYLSTASEVTEMQQAVRARLSEITVTNEQMQSLASALYTGYESWAKASNRPDIDVISTKFGEYLKTESAQAILLSAAGDVIDQEALTKEVSEAFSGAMQEVSGQISQQISGVIKQMMQKITKQIGKSIEKAMGSFVQSLGSSMSGLFNIDTSALGNMFSMNMSAEEIQDLITSLMSGGSDSYENNLASMGYADLNEPTGISLYPRDFESKAEVTSFLDSYNQAQKNSGHEENVITYTDMVATMMSSVTKIVNAISYVLVAFVSISLIVSSIMIGVITYISVLERRKEIGVLRAIGASKGNISQVFNAETFITGILAGSIGVGISALLTIPINQIILNIAKVEGVRASLPIPAAIILIILSTVLTMIAGLLPAGKAAKSDPVAALRSD